MYKISIDVGGTYIKWALIDEEYKIIKRGKEKTNAFTLKAKGVIKLLAEICNNLEKECPNQIIGVGLSIPGIIDSFKKEAVVAINYIPGAEDLNFAEEFGKYCDLRLEVLNDAKAATIGEFKFGSLKEHNDSIMVTLGTGIGSGIIINGKLHFGNNFSAGESGQHKTSDLKWEDNASTRWLVIISNFIKGDNTLNGENIMDLIKSDYEIQNEYMNWMNNIAQGMANLILILSPTRISVGGGISENENFDIDLLQELTNDKVGFDFQNKTEIVKATLGNDAGLLGIASWLQEKIDEEN